MQNESSLLSQEKMVCTYCNKVQSEHAYKIYSIKLCIIKSYLLNECAATVCFGEPPSLLGYFLGAHAPLWVAHLNLITNTV
jgi:hypothetical protein